MKVFVINSGSSSIKYQLFEMPEAQVLCSGIVDRIGQDNAEIRHKFFLNGKEELFKSNLRIQDHAAALIEVQKLLLDEKIGPLKNPDQIEIVGHRVVHGGERFSETVIITTEIKEAIKSLFALAPLHNPHNYLGIETAEQVFSNAKQVAVFDTAFHQTMPVNAYRFAIPNVLYENYQIRAYGFHGTSHKYVTTRAADLLNKKDAKLISIHLGNGCSMAAVNSGKCLDTSMGFGPMNGLVMGTRCGDLDQSVIFYLINQLGYKVEEVQALLNTKSGLLGLGGHSDMRELRAALNKGNREASLAYDVYSYRIKKFIGAYYGVLDGADALIFTGGVGENDSLVRELSCQQLTALGIVLDKEKNLAEESGERDISEAYSRVKVFVVPTNEEKEIAQQVYSLVSCSHVDA